MNRFINLITDTNLNQRTKTVYVAKFLKIKFKKMQLDYMIIL